MGISIYIYDSNIVMNKIKLSCKNRAVYTYNEFMAQLTDNIAATLKAYDISKRYNLPGQFYNDMA